MKKIYIILTHTGTMLSRIIKQYTKDEFSHVSISLDQELNEMYSFGRLRPNNPFIGGFVHEYINKGTFKRFYNTVCRVFSLEVTDEQYQKIQNNIKKIGDNKNDYTFNILGLFAAGMHKRISKDHSFYCAEFVRYIMESADVHTGLPEIIKPEDFKQIENLREIYSGLLRNYHLPRITVTDIIRNSLLLNNKKEGII